MTATLNPFGMVPVENLAAGYNTQGFESFDILDGYTTSIFYGDVVKLATTGVIQKDTGTTALTPIGVFVGASYVEPSLGYFLTTQAWPASTTTSVTTDGGRPMGKVVSDPNAVFMIQSDGTLTKAAIGANAAIVQTAGTLAVGKSRNALQASSVDVTSTLPLRIVGLWEGPGNVWGDAYPIVLVKFNNHQYTTLTGI